MLRLRENCNNASLRTREQVKNENRGQASRRSGTVSRASLLRTRERTQMEKKRFLRCGERTPTKKHQQTRTRRAHALDNWRWWGAESPASSQQLPHCAGTRLYNEAQARPIRRHVAKRPALDVEPLLKVPERPAPTDGRHAIDRWVVFEFVASGQGANSRECGELGYMPPQANCECSCRRPRGRLKGMRRTRQETWHHTLLQRKRGKNQRPPVVVERDK